MRLTDASKTVNTFALMNMLSVRGVKCCSRPATWSELTECAPAASVVTVSSMRLSALIGRTPLDYPNVHTPAGLARIHTIHLSAAWLTEIDSMRHIKRHAHTNSNRQYKTAAWTEQLKWHHEIFPPPPLKHTDLACGFNSPSLIRKWLGHIKYCVSPDNFWVGYTQFRFWRCSFVFTAQRLHSKRSKIHMFYIHFM